VKKILSEIEAIKKRLDDIEKRLDALEEEPQTPTFPPFRGPLDRPVPKTYADLKLPPNPTKKQAREYVLAIKKRLRGRTSWGSTDPEIRLLAKVGRKHVDVILDAIGSSRHGPFSSHAVDAIKMIAGEEHRQSIIDKLPICHGLVKVVLQKGWERHARQILLDELSEGSGWIPTEWITAVVRLRDPATYSALLDYLRTGNNPHMTYQELAGLHDLTADGLDWAVSGMWERFKGKGSMHAFSRDGAARIAAGHGHVDAFEHIVGLLEKSGRSTWSVHMDLRAYVLSLVSFRGTNSEIRSWLETNRDRLAFDRAKKKYYVKDDRGEEGF
jgi:hypothetical protein